LEKKGARRAGRNFATASGPLMQLWRAPVAEPEQRERLPLPLVETFDLAGRTRLIRAQRDGHHRLHAARSALRRRST